jgi:hypothetical protein
MTSFSERLAAAKAAARPTRDVQVLLDADLSEKREELRAELERVKATAANDPRLSAVDPEETDLQEKLDAVLEESADALVTLRFTRLPGNEWSDLTSRCPVRLDAPIDRQYGYNMQAVSTLAAPISGVRVEDDAEVSLEDSEWVDLFETISGHEFILVMDAIYELNEYEPAQRVSSLKKALATRPA